jgi:DNA-binding MarR family transcriptional regulator
MHPTDPFIAAMHKWIAVFMRRSMRDFMRYSRQSGLSMSQLGALLHIHHQGGGGVSDLGDDMGVSSAAASQMLERLAQQGLILRSEDPHDRRARQIVLSDKGRQALQEGMRARQGWLDDLGDELSEGEKQQVIAALEVLTEKATCLLAQAEHSE